MKLTDIALRNQLEFLLLFRQNIISKSVSKVAMKVILQARESAKALKDQISVGKRL